MPWGCLAVSVQGWFLLPCSSLKRALFVCLSITHQNLAVAVKRLFLKHLDGSEEVNSSWL